MPPQSGKKATQAHKHVNTHFDAAHHNDLRLSWNRLGSSGDCLQSNLCCRTSVMLMDDSHEITDLQSVFAIIEMGESAPFKEVSALLMRCPDTKGCNQTRQ